MGYGGEGVCKRGTVCVCVRVCVHAPACSRASSVCVRVFVCTGLQWRFPLCLCVCECVCVCPRLQDGPRVFVPG